MLIGNFSSVDNTSRLSSVMLDAGISFPFLQDPYDTHITPVSDIQWRTVRQDAQLNRLWPQCRHTLDRFAQCVGTDDRTFGRKIIPTVKSLIYHFSEVVSAGHRISRFAPSPASHALQSDELLKLLDLVWTEIRSAVGGAAMTNSTVETLTENIARIDSIVESFSLPMSNDIEVETGEFILSQVLEVDMASLPMASGLSLGGLLTSKWQGDDLKVLERRIAQALGTLIPDKLDYFPFATEHPLQLLMSRRPYYAHKTFELTLELVRASYRERGSECAVIIAESGGSETEAWSTHQDVARTRESLLEVDDPELILRLCAHLYRMALESHLRGALQGALRLSGDVVPNQRVTMNALIELAQAAGNRLAKHLIEPANTDWRNAAAHEEVSWNDDSDTAVIHGATVHLGDLYAKAEQLIAARAAYESAIAFAKAADGSLRSDLDTAFASKKSSLTTRREITHQLGIRGVSVVSTSRKGDLLKVQLESWNDSQLAVVAYLVHVESVNDWRDAKIVITCDEDEGLEYVLTREALKGIAGLTVVDDYGNSALRAPWYVLPAIASIRMNQGGKPLRVHSEMIWFAADHLDTILTLTDEDLSRSSTSLSDELAYCLAALKCGQLCLGLSNSANANRILKRFEQMKVDADADGGRISRETFVERHSAWLIDLVSTLPGSPLADSWFRPRRTRTYEPGGRLASSHSRQE